MSDGFGVIFMYYIKYLFNICTGKIETQSNHMFFKGKFTLFKVQAVDIYLSYPRSRGLFGECIENANDGSAGSNVGDGIPEGSPALPDTLIEGCALGKPSACCSYLFPPDARPNLHWATCGHTTQ